MFRFVVSYRDCVEWLLFEIDMSSSSAPQFSFLFVKYSLLFLVFCLCLAFTCDCSLCTLGTHYHYITVKSVMWESRSRALLSFLQSNRDSNGINNGFNNATTNSMIVPLEQFLYVDISFYGCSIYYYCYYYCIVIERFDGLIAYCSH